MLETPRLLLRGFTLADAPEVRRLAGDRAIADTTLNIPHPYEPGVAEQWIASHRGMEERGAARTWAVVLRGADRLVGAIGLTLKSEQRRAEMGYWIGLPYWNNGYATEAAAAVVAYGFDTLRLHRIHACHLARNPASGRVMQKVGMIREGTLRGHVRMGGVFEDVVVYGWRAPAAAGAAPRALDVAPPTP
jgi:RimJ/RimL family protein N-acetyltransferase